MSVEYQHIPVLSEEAINLLNLKEGGTYVDCTLGGGGHANKLKMQNSKCKIIGIDQDQEAIRHAKEILSKYDQIEYVNDNFINLDNIIKEPADGFLFDLGVSSHQIDKDARGFSLQKDGPLDMRMGQSIKLDAKDIINNFSREELERIFREFGEERFARLVAKAVVNRRRLEEIGTTFQLKIIVEKAIPGWRKRESVTRIFQALRIAVNNELESLQMALHSALNLLKPGGRVVVISYHSLEDRITKQTFKSASKEGRVNILTKKPIVPSPEEIASNPRAHSAKLRAAEKI